MRAATSAAGSSRGSWWPGIASAAWHASRVSWIHACGLAIPNVEVMRCDVSDRQTLADAMNGCGPAYYLVHSMLAAGPSYRERDRMLADDVF